MRRVISIDFYRFSQTLFTQPKPSKSSNRSYPEAKRPTDIDKGKKRKLAPKRQTSNHFIPSPPLLPVIYHLI